MNKKLNGKVAIVTGASSGIGFATALALVKEGAQVTITARREERLELLATKIKNLGGQCLVVIADLTDQVQVENIVTKTERQFGTLDILVNSAGIMLLGPIDNSDTADWRSMVELNLLGLMNLTHKAIPIMKSQNEGHIVNISSVAGRVARAFVATYSATKWGVCAFSESLRQEVCKNNIRVTIIEPGAVATELVEHIRDPIIKKHAQQFYKSITPLEADDVARAIIYAVTQPKHVNINEMMLLPTEQERAF